VLCPGHRSSSPSHIVLFGSEEPHGGWPEENLAKRRSGRKWLIHFVRKIVMKWQHLAVFDTRNLENTSHKDSSKLNGT
jgi:hypothetical protein